MEKKSVSASLLILYLTALFAVVGSCFYTFVFIDKQIKIESVSVIAASGISVFNDEDKTQKSNSLNLSDMEIGVRPATGKLDKDTHIPSTITDDGTTEGYYAVVYVDSQIDYQIVIKNIKIESEKDDLLIKDERENIFVSIKDVENTTTDLKNDEIKLATFSGVDDTQKLTFLFWLGSFAGDDLQGAKISFELSFEAV